MIHCGVWGIRFLVLWECALFNSSKFLRVNESIMDGTICLRKWREISGALKNLSDYSRQNTGAPQGREYSMWVTSEFCLYFTKLWSYESYCGERMKDKKQQQRDRPISVTRVRALGAIFSDHRKLNLWFRSKQDWELPRLRQVGMVKTQWLAFHSKLFSSPFPCHPIHC